MSQSVITTAFEQLKAQQAANGGVLVLDEFVFANIPNLNINDPIDRAESWPAASQIVYRQSVSKTGMVNNNAVVYSVVLGADVGDFEFNWVGLINKAANAVCMIVHAPVQKKIKTASGQQGNVLTRSFLMEYDGASRQTQIITPVDTWQIDFTARLGGVDERQRQENIDLYGDAGFLGDGWRVTKKTSTKYNVQSGVGYVAGLRAELLANQDITVTAKPNKIWVDVCWRGTLTSAWSAVSKITVVPDLDHYSDNGERHFVFALAEIAADGTVTDLRPRGSLAFRKFDDLPGFYLNRQEPFADIKSDGAEAMAKAHANLELKSAAKREVGTGENQIPDMSSFTTGYKEVGPVWTNSKAGWRKHPDGTIEQWGMFGFAKNSTGTNVVFEVPFPTRVESIVLTLADMQEAQIAPTAMPAYGVNSVGVSRTGFTGRMSGSGGFNLCYIAIGR